MSNMWAQLCDVIPEHQQVGGKIVTVRETDRKMLFFSDPYCQTTGAKQHNEYENKKVVAQKQKCSEVQSDRIKRQK